jgi:hypothetical protein
MRILFFILFLLGSPYCSGANLLEGHYQLLVVTASDWNTNKGNLQLFERGEDDNDWNLSLDPLPVVIGKKGLGWGKGIHPFYDKLYPNKKEGDNKSPAGIFTLGSAFGFASKAEISHLKIDYFPINEFTEAVDDPSSIYYNQIVNSNEVLVDWNSSEKMSTIPLYKIGLVVNHNFPNPFPGEGSAIFFHIWRGENLGTGGCTAMSEENMEKILYALDGNKNPILVQLPLFVYEDLKISWCLPELEFKHEQ